MALHLRLEGDEHVADSALDEARCRRPPAGVEHRDIGEQLAHEFLRLLLVALVGFKRVGVSREIGIAPVAGGFRIGEDDLHILSDEIVPILDGLRIARTHEKGRERVIGHEIDCQSAGMRPP
jgi:hypothetical protein